ncbi:MAG: hypothetical protein ACPIOQ_67785, partial [Promethearchaeia archaeon]
SLRPRLACLEAGAGDCNAPYILLIHPAVYAERTERTSSANASPVFERTPSAASHKRERERTREVRSPSGKSAVRLPSDQSRRPHRVQGSDLPHRAVRWSERNRGKSRPARDPLS